MVEKAKGGWPSLCTMKKSHKLTTVLFLLCLFSSPCRASNEKTCDDPCGKPTPWDDFNIVELKMTVPERPGYASWKAQFDKGSMDIQMDVETFDGNSTVRGKILMVGGRIMATQGPITEPGYELDALDVPVLEMQLVLRVLGRVLPRGPADLRGFRKIDYRDAKVGIQFATPSADGFIPTPWSVKGDVNVIASDTITYELSLRYKRDESGSSLAQEQVTHFEGRLLKAASVKIDDRFSLEGWNVLGVGPQTRKLAGETIVDYSAAPTTSQYRTIADIRKKIAEDDYPGEPDGTKDFTGFWKENCKDAFGLQIMHHGKEGKYSVVFCGPGGCGDQDEGRSTFITGDKHYQVISENEIKTHPSDTGWDTYYRCTTDTHPVLKYKDP